MSDDLKKGDRVEWNTSQGTTRGTVERKLTDEMWIGDHKVAASPDNPEYLVRSEKSGDLAAHKPFRPPQAPEARLMRRQTQLKLLL